MATTRSEHLVSVLGLSKNSKPAFEDLSSWYTSHMLPVMSRGRGILWPSFPQFTLLVDKGWDEQWPTKKLQNKPVSLQAEFINFCLSSSRSHLNLSSTCGQCFNFQEKSSAQMTFWPVNCIRLGRQQNYLSSSQYPRVLKFRAGQNLGWTAFSFWIIQP